MQKFQPFILTKDKLQAAVYGAGYPSLPTYSVEEFFDMEAAAGRLPDQGYAYHFSNNRNNNNNKNDFFL